MDKRSLVKKIGSIIEEHGFEYTVTYGAFNDDILYRVRNPENDKVCLAKVTINGEWLFNFDKRVREFINGIQNEISSPKGETITISLKEYETLKEQNALMIAELKHLRSFITELFEKGEQEEENESSHT